MKLATWMQKSRLKQTDLAEKLATGKARAHRIYHEKILPKPLEVVAIYRWSKGAVQPNDFYDLSDPGPTDGLPLFAATNGTGDPGLNSFTHPKGGP